MLVRFDGKKNCLYNICHNITYIYINLKGRNRDKIGSLVLKKFPFYLAYV